MNLTICFIVLSVFLPENNTEYKMKINKADVLFVKQRIEAAEIVLRYKFWNGLETTDTIRTKESFDSLSKRINDCTDN